MDPAQNLNELLERGRVGQQDHRDQAQRAFGGQQGESGQARRQEQGEGGHRQNERLEQEEPLQEKADGNAARRDEGQEKARDARQEPGRRMGRKDDDQDDDEGGRRLEGGGGPVDRAVDPAISVPIVVAHQIPGPGRLPRPGASPPDFRWRARANTNETAKTRTAPMIPASTVASDREPMPATL